MIFDESTESGGRGREEARGALLALSKTRLELESALKDVNR